MKHRIYIRAIVALATLWCAWGISTALAQSESPSPAPADTVAMLCVQVFGPEPSDGWTADSLSQSVADGSAKVLTVNDAAGCASEAPAPATATPEPTETPVAVEYDDAVIIDTIDTGVQRVLDWSERLASGTLSGRATLRLMGQMGVFAKNQIALDYEPSPCMQDAWAHYRQGMSLLRGKTVALLRWLIRTNGYGSIPASIGEGFTRSGELLGQARNEADSLSCSPTGA